MPLPAGMANVSGKLILPDGAAAPSSKVKFELVYCSGNLGRVLSVGTIINPAFFLDVAADGTWSTVVFGNDVIVCGSDDTGPSRWRISYIVKGAELPSTDYQINSGADFSPDNASLCTSDTPGVTDINCAVQYPYVSPPPPPIAGPQGPPGATGPQGPAGPSGAAALTFFVGPGRTDVMDAATTNVSMTTVGNNVVSVLRFNLRGSITISKASTIIGVGFFSGRTNVGIYSIAGNKLMDASFDNTIEGTLQTVSFTPLALTPGEYFLAWGASSQATMPGWYGIQTASGYGLFSGTSPVKWGTAANAYVSPNLPATLGTITPFTSAPGTGGVPAILFEP